MSPKLNVLHVTFDMGIGGAERVIRHLVIHGDHHTFNFEVFCIDGTVGEFGRELQNYGINISTFTRHPGFDFSLLIQLNKYIRTQRIDIIHCHQYTPFVYGALAASLTKCKVIFTEHGRFYPESFKLKRWLFNPFLSLITKQITAISQATVEALIKFENIPKHKISKIYNGIDYPYSTFTPEQKLSIKRELGLAQDDIVLGTISRLDTIKNQALMLKSLSTLTQHIENIKLIIVGDGPELKSLKQLAKQLNIKENVIFTGFRVNPNPCLQVMDIYLLTSFSEGTSMTLLEAMACEKPIVVTNVGGNPEVIVDNVSGIVIENDDLEGLNNAVNKLLKNHLLSSILAKNAQKRFVEEFNIQNMIKNYEELYLFTG